MQLAAATATAKHKLAGAHLHSAGPCRVTGAGTRTRSTDAAHANVDCQHTSTMRLSPRRQHATRQPPAQQMGSHVSWVGGPCWPSVFCTRAVETVKSLHCAAPLSPPTHVDWVQGAKTTLHVFSTLWCPAARRSGLSPGFQTHGVRGAASSVACRRASSF